MMLRTIFKNSTTSFKNLARVDALSALETIHHKEKNIAIYQREIGEMEKEVELLIQSNVCFKSSGSKNEILTKLTEQLQS